MEGIKFENQAESPVDYANMTSDQLEKDPVASKILQKKALEYLKTQDMEWFDREFTGEMTEDGYLVDKKGAANTKPFQSIGGGDSFIWVIENTKKELLNDPDFVQPRGSKGMESDNGANVSSPEAPVQKETDGSEQVETLEDKKLRLAIAEAPDFRALYAIIQENDGLQGSQKHYSFDELTALIGKVHQGADAKLLTNAFGLRQKVQYLMGMEKAK